MRDALLYILQQLVDQPQDVTVEEQTSESGKALIAHVAPEDMGKIIGKNGRIIRAIRELVKLSASKVNTYVEVVLVE